MVEPKSMESKRNDIMVVQSFQCYPKALRNTETMFGVTQKEKSPTNSSNDDNANIGIVGRITFNESPIFIPATMVLLVHQNGLVIEILGFRPTARSGNGFGIGEVICSVCVVLCLWTFLKGLFDGAQWFKALVMKLEIMKSMYCSENGSAAGIQTPRGYAGPGH
ncbi:hypothetical protein RHSIM_Rhsim06G0165000 [Rhododendron simsii]|uniref:Uncharacterized protein n=1 Tax=Rhododendron simsii TaxID=118357 RepID=A0A834GTW8_RHOSS|nr:hypothetical protein RHSIM_Rhsim06G0165000 [Rhododendron simsii]